MYAVDEDRKGRVHFLTSFLKRIATTHTPYNSLLIMQLLLNVEEKKRKL